MGTLIDSSELVQAERGQRDLEARRAAKGGVATRDLRSFPKIPELMMVQW